MLQTKVLSGNDGNVRVDDISANTMKQLLTFIYKDIIAKEDIDPDLLIAAEKYNIERLFDIASNHLLNEINADNVMEIMIATYLVPNCQDLFKSASNFAMKHRGELVKTSRWEYYSKTYPDIVLKVVDEIMFKP